MINIELSNNKRIYRLDRNNVVLQELHENKKTGSKSWVTLSYHMNVFEAAKAYISSVETDSEVEIKSLEDYAKFYENRVNELTDALEIELDMNNRIVYGVDLEKLKEKLGGKL